MLRYKINYICTKQPIPKCKKMRKHLLFPALAATLAASSFISCRQAQNEADNLTAGLEHSSSMQFIEYSDTAVMDMPEMIKIVGKPAYATIITSGVFPVKLGDTDIRPLQNAIMSAAYGKEGGSIADAIEYFNTHPALVEDGDSLVRATMPLQRDSAVSEQYSIISVQTMTNELMSFAIYQYIYPYGAAHGMNGTSYVNYYQPTQQLLTADNLFEPASRTDIINTLRLAAKDQYATIDTMVDPDEIESFDNFYVTQSGITFVYAPYEIAPYAAGQVSVSVAAYRLYDYLTPLGKTVFGL